MRHLHKAEKVVCMVIEMSTCIALAVGYYQPQEGSSCTRVVWECTVVKWSCLPPLLVAGVLQQAGNSHKAWKCEW